MEDQLLLAWYLMTLDVKWLIHCDTLILRTRMVTMTAVITTIPTMMMVILPIQWFFFHNQRERYSLNYQPRLPKLVYKFVAFWYRCIACCHFLGSHRGPQGSNWRCLADFFRHRFAHVGLICLKFSTCIVLKVDIFLRPNSRLGDDFPIFIAASWMTWQMGTCTNCTNPCLLHSCG